VAFSVLSCLATNICLAPLLAAQGNFRLLTKRMLPGFAGICLAIAIDLACQNVALAILSIALQQCIKATLPTATVVVESLLRRKRFHTAIYASVVAICIGPILVATTSSWEARSAAGSQLYGALMMILAMVGGAFKYVLCHKAITTFREEMGVLAFTFWVEVFVGLMLVPWAVISGEAYQLATAEHTVGEWALMWCTAAFGGVRIVAQFAFLASTSATSLAMSNIAMQAFTILIGIAAFGTAVTPLLISGVACTIVTSALYAYLKTSKVLSHANEPTKPKPVPNSETRHSNEEDRVGLRTADSAQAL